MENKMKNTSEAPVVDIDMILKRLEELEERFPQLENVLKDMVTFDTLAARLLVANKKTRKGTRAKREWTPEEKAALHEEWLLRVWQSKRLVRKLLNLNQKLRNPSPVYTVL